jgi:hypothetical protein
MNRSILADLMVGLGSVCLIIAAAWIWPPAGLLVAGLLFFVIGVRLEQD